MHEHDNYAPPSANLAESDNGEPDRPKSFLRSRPIFVYVIFLISFLQIAFIAHATYSGWEIFMAMLAQGEISPVEFFGGYIFPGLYAVAGLLLLFMRKTAAFAFTVYFLWSLLKYMGLSRGTPTIYDMIMTTCIVAYCWWLYRAGRLT